MKVKELIEKLQECDPEAVVVADRHHGPIVRGARKGFGYLDDSGCIFSYGGTSVHGKSQKMVLIETMEWSPDWEERLWDYE